MKLDLIAFGAHPDDVELFAGGTLAKMAALGHAVGIVDLTRGEAGTRGTSAIRFQEARKAAKVLKVKIRENLGLPDGEVSLTSEARNKIIRIIREFRPSLVLTHHWDDRHPDHTNTSLLVSAAVHHAGLVKIRTGQESYRPGTILYFKLPAGVRPSLIVDVSEFDNQKMRAIRCHRSQLFSLKGGKPNTYLSQPDFLSRIDSIHSYYGALIGKKKGEGFCVRGMLEISDPIDFFNQMSSLRFT
jgi:bacillithiol biosynthesis deacetylase BshB1